MRRSLATALLLATSLLAAPPAFAQRTTGGIAGTVSDESGAVLPGVTVAVSGERVMGSPEAVTDEEGGYRFPSLAPGLYELTVRLAGFNPARRTDVRVQLGTTTEENVALSVATLAETVEVRASGAVVDTQSSKVDTNYDREWIENAPLPRKSFFDLVGSAPGVDPSFNQRFPSPGSFGTFGDQNLYQLDGIDLTDSYSFEASTLVQPSVDIVEEAQILSLGAPAEYGSVQGAVFNFVTRQGSNNFRGAASFYYQNDGLTGRNTTAEEECVFNQACLASGGRPFTRTEFKDASAQLGGPIKKDRLWFFGAYNHVRDSFVVVGVAPSTVDKTTLDHGFGKLNFQLDPKSSFVGSLTFEHRALDVGLFPNQSPSQQNSRDRRVLTPTLAYTGTLSSSTVLEVRYAGFYSVNKGGATPGATRKAGRTFFNFDTGQQSGDPFGYYEFHLSRTAVNTKLSHHASDFLGASHDFKFGVQYNNSPVTAESHYSDTIFAYTSGGVLGGYGYIYNPFTYAASATTVGSYVDDSVSIGTRLNLNLGVRYDRTRTRGDETPELDPVTSQPTGVVFPQVDYFSWNSIAPRVGFNLKLTADGRSVLKGHYGRYYPGGSTGNLAHSGPSIAPSFRGDYNFTSGQFENVTLRLARSIVAWDTDTKPSKTDQFILSLERELFGQLNLSATYLHKRTRRLLGWLDEGGTYETLTYVDNVGPEATGGSFDVFRLVSSPESRRFVLQAPPGTRTDYHGLTLGATKRMSSQWQLTASATFGKATRDRIQGIDSTQNFQGFGQNPNQYVNSDGLTPRDRFFVFKTQALYAGLPWGVSVSANYVYAGGYPYRRGVQIPGIGRVPGAPLTGDKRFPSSNILDLRLQKDVKLSERARVSLFANTFNLFNDGAYQEFQDHLGTSDLFMKPKGFILPRRFMLGAKVDF